MSEPLNGVGNRHWRLFSDDNYFDTHGVFTSLVWATPLLGNALLAVVSEETHSCGAEEQKTGLEDARSDFCPSCCLSLLVVPSSIDTPDACESEARTVAGNQEEETEIKNGDKDTFCLNKPNKQQTSNMAHGLLDEIINNASERSKGCVIS